MALGETMNEEDFGAGRIAPLRPSGVFTFTGLNFWSAAKPGCAMARNKLAAIVVLT
jgi:hypothetical protein